MHRAGGHVHKSTGRTYDGLARTGELDFARDHIEGLVPVVAMRRRTHSVLALMPRDFVSLCRRVRSQHGHLDTEYVQRGIVVSGGYNKRLSLRSVISFLTCNHLSSPWSRPESLQTAHSVMGEQGGALYRRFEFFLGRIRLGELDVSNCSSTRCSSPANG